MHMLLNRQIAMRGSAFASAILLLLSPCLFSGSTAQAQATPSALQTSAAPQESLLIGPGDLLHITVFDEPEMEQRVRVNDAGEISLNLIGKIAVKGLSSGQAAALIKEKYQQGSFLNNPQVSVMVEEFAAESVSLIGQVQRPGPINLTTPRSILDVIALGGGMTDIADRNITIQRRNGEKLKVFVPNKVDAALEQSNVMVYPGDIVMVPKAGIVYVLGDVARPGGYVMNNDSQLTVLQALAMAAGTNHTAKESKARLVRKQSDNTIKEQTIHLTEMQKGKIPDMPLEANDIIWVPFSWAKSFAAGATSITASAAGAAIYTTR